MNETPQTSATYHRTVGVAELADRAPQTIDVAGKLIAVVRIEERVYAVDALCTHMGVPLEKGSVDDHELVCPWHAARFCVRTGSKTSGPGQCDLNTYPVRVVEGFVEVGLVGEQTCGVEPLNSQPVSAALPA